MEKKVNVIMTKADIQHALLKMARQIIAENSSLNNLALIGIRSRGIDLAKRINNYIQNLSQTSLPIGIIDTTLYRDDISSFSYKPVLKKTEINFSVDNKNIVLIDDVLYTGRTIRAALDALTDLGRPKTIKLAVLVDRGNRELPISADYIGLTFNSSQDESVKVTLEEAGDEDKVFILPFPEKTRW